MLEFVEEANQLVDFLGYEVGQASKFKNYCNLATYYTINSEHLKSN